MIFEGKQHFLQRNKNKTPSPSLPSLYLTPYSKIPNTRTHYKLQNIPQNLTISRNPGRTTISHHQFTFHKNMENITYQNPHLTTLPIASWLYLHSSKHS